MKSDGTMKKDTNFHNSKDFRQYDFQHKARAGIDNVVIANFSPWSMSKLGEVPLTAKSAPFQGIPSACFLSPHTADSHQVLGRWPLLQAGKVFLARQ